MYMELLRVEVVTPLGKTVLSVWPARLDHLYEFPPMGCTVYSGSSAFLK